jgi:hypothetical protein
MDLLAGSSSLHVDSSALDEFKALAEKGSDGFRDYLDFSVQARAKLENDVLSVLHLLEEANKCASELESECVQGTSAHHEREDVGGDGDLIKALEARNIELEEQLTEVWDELIIKDENLKKTQRQLDDAQKDQIAQAERTSKSFAKQANELSS